MKILKTTALLLLVAIAVTACSSTPEAKKDTDNSAQSQKKNAAQAQRELSSETRK